MTEVDFSYPNSTLLDGRSLLYTMQRTAHGFTVRIDAQVTWVSAKPLAAYVAPGASRVMVEFTSPFNRFGPYKSHPIVRATVVSALAIQRITAAVNAMRAAPLGTHLCPSDFGTTLTVDFWDSGSPHPFAKVVVDRTGCQDVTITHYDLKGSPTATGYASSWGAAQVIARLAGVHEVPLAYPRS